MIMHRKDFKAYKAFEGLKSKGKNPRTIYDDESFFMNYAGTARVGTVGTKGNAVVSPSFKPYVDHRKHILDGFYVHSIADMRTDYIEEANEFVQIKPTEQDIEINRKAKEELQKITGRENI